MKKSSAAFSKDSDDEKSIKVQTKSVVNIEKKGLKLKKKIDKSEQKEEKVQESKTEM